jgi:hypothetical protein
VALQPRSLCAVALASRPTVVVALWDDFCPQVFAVLSVPRQVVKEFGVLQQMAVGEVVRPDPVGAGPAQFCGVIVSSLLTSCTQCAFVPRRFGFGPGCRATRMPRHPATGTI